MRVKITQPGWLTYTGDLGTVQFENGVSMAPMPHREAMALGAYISVVEIDENGEELGPVSPGLDQVRVMTVEAVVEAPIVRLSDVLAQQKLLDEEERARLEAEGEVLNAPEPARHIYNQDELEDIAAEKGIVGLREIGDPLGVKGTSIRGLIADILLKQPKA